METYKVKVKKLQTVMTVYNVKADSILGAYLEMLLCSDKFLKKYFTILSSRE